MQQTGLRTLAPEVGSWSASPAAVIPADQLPLTTRLGYGLGEMAEGVKTATLETFLFFYYVQVVGLQASLVGLALLIALLFDGISDPLIGQLSDRTVTRLGRRHPYLYLAPVPLACALYMLFDPPGGLGQWGQFFWLLGFTAFCRLMQSFYFIPHMALGAELSTDFKERISVSGYRNIFAFAGRLLVLAIAFNIFFQSTPDQPQGQLNGAAYPNLALTCGVIALVAILVSAATTQQRALRCDARMRSQGRGQHHEPALRNLANAFRLRTFAIYFVAILISYVLGGVQAALAVHVNTYYWQLPTWGIQWVFIGAASGFMLGSLLARALADRFDKRTAYVASVLLSVALNVAPIVLRETGLVTFPENGQALSALLAGAGFLASLAGGPAMVIAGAMLADIADAYELRFKSRSEGFLFGVSAFTRKASLGLGGALAGVALDLIRFPQGVAVGAVPRDATVHLALLYGPMMLVFTAIAMSIMWFYDLDRDQHARILHELETERR
jgi:Na+/melibiose symporter-like transporter